MRVLLLPLLVLAAAPLSLRAQQPAAEPPKNLKVLPRDMTREQVVQVMRSFAGGLGVRCQYCHAYKPGAPQDGSLQNIDFASDENPAKDQARVMMRMVDVINETLLAPLPDRSNPPVRVQCLTCHRGSPVPRTLDRVLAETIAEEGVDSAIVEYRRLRNDMALGRYNFGEGTLNEVARQLATGGKHADAIRILLLNQEFYPESANIFLMLGESYLAAGQKEKAVESLKKAQEKQPNNPMIKRRLQELGIN